MVFSFLMLLLLIKISPLLIGNRIEYAVSWLLIIAKGLLNLQNVLVLINQKWIYQLPETWFLWCLMNTSWVVNKHKSFDKVKLLTEVLSWNPINTRCRFNVYRASPMSCRRFLDVETTSCVYWENFILMTQVTLHLVYLLNLFGKAHRAALFLRKIKYN